VIATEPVIIRSRQADRIKVGTRRPVESLVLASPRHVANHEYTGQFFNMSCLYLVVFGVVVDGVERRFTKFGYTKDLHKRIQAHQRELANVSVAPDADDPDGDDQDAGTDGDGEDQDGSNSFFQVYAVVPTPSLDHAQLLEDFVKSAFAGHLVSGLVHGTGKKRGQITEVLQGPEDLPLSLVEERVLAQREKLNKLSVQEIELQIQLLRAQAELALAQSKRIDAEANKIRAENERMQLERGYAAALAASSCSSSSCPSSCPAG
jgi:hypothetical protein